MNHRGIPPEMEAAIRERDQTCVYCRVAFLELDSNDGSRKRVAT